MNHDSYGEAAAQVLDILKHTNINDVKKIPKSVIECLEQMKTKDYKLNIDYSKNINEMNLLPKTEAILGWIFIKYYENEEEVKKFKTKIRKNEIKYNEELKKIYNSENLFKKRRLN